MNIPHELKPCKACTDLTERLLADRLIELRMQCEKKLSEIGIPQSNDDKTSMSSYSDSVKRLRQALSNYVKLEDDPQTLIEGETDKNTNSNDNTYSLTQLFID